MLLHVAIVTLFFSAVGIFKGFFYYT